MFAESSYFYKTVQKRLFIERYVLQYRRVRGTFAKTKGPFAFFGPMSLIGPNKGSAAPQFRGVAQAGHHFMVVSAHAEYVFSQRKLHDLVRLQLAAAIDAPAVIFDFPPTSGERLAVIFDIAFARRPMRVKVCQAKDLRLFALGKGAQYRRPRAPVQPFAIQADPLFSHGKGGDPAAVCEIEVNFSAFYKRFAMNRFTNDRIWYIIIGGQNHPDVFVRSDRLIRVIQV